MSLPGLLQSSAPAVPVLTTAIHHLPEGTEWRFEVAFESTVEIKLLSGSAELFGTELAQKQTYAFSGAKAAIYTWHGCTIEVAGECQVEYLAEETPMVSYANLHFALERKREEAASTGRDGPKVLVLGPEDAGKTSLVKLLTAYATRSGRQPVTVNLDPKEGLLSIPGSLSATTFSSIIDVEEGWGSSPTNGPSPIPVKLPLVYHCGQANPDDGNRIYKPVVTRLALAALSKLQEDAEARVSGCIVDTPGSISHGKGGYEIIQHIVSELSTTSDLLASLLPGGEADDTNNFQRPIYEKVEPSPQMQNAILAIVQADVNDTPENIRDASVMGYLQMREVDEKKRRVQILSPLSGRIPHRALIWGSWPDVGEL
ncbi:MAG: hypothetical protein Q9166_003884 [cf. Caloplaca sp. 2 TL-2023]